MGEFVGSFLSLLFQALYFAIFARFILSWIDQGGQWRITQIVIEITEPVLAPLRRIIPTIGMIDLSPMVAIILLQPLQGLVAGAFR